MRREEGASASEKGLTRLGRALATLEREAALVNQHLGCVRRARGVSQGVVRAKTRGSGKGAQSPTPAAHSPAHDTTRQSRACGGRGTLGSAHGRLRRHLGHA